MKRFGIKIGAFCALTLGITVLTMGIGSLLMGMSEGLPPTMQDLSLMPIGILSWVGGVFLSRQR
jgi:hypothetical protein